MNENNKTSSKGKQIGAFSKKVGSDLPEEAKLKFLLKRAVNTEIAPAHLRMAISALIRN